MVCRNPLLARSRAHKREDLLAATEKDLAKIHAATLRPKNPLRGKGKIGLKLCRNTIVSSLPGAPLLATRDRTNLSPAKYPRSPEPNPNL